MLIVLTGKTASGKDTVMARLLDKLPNLKRVVTTTTRQPRPEEKNGADYNFVTPEAFGQMIDSGELLEYVEYGGNLYGTQKKELIGGKDQDLIWRIDPSRAGQIRKLLSEKLLVIYLTVSDSIVLQRLKARGLAEEEIKRRLSEDQKFWNQYKNSYDFVVENIPGKLDQTVEKVLKIINEKK